MSIVNVNNVYHVKIEINNDTIKYVRDATGTEVPPEHVLHKFLAITIDADWPYAGSIFTTVKASKCLQCGGRIYKNPVVGNIGVIKAIAKQMGFDVKVSVCSEEGCKAARKVQPLVVEDRNLPFFWS